MHMPAPSPLKDSPLRPGKTVSVMSWIENENGHVLLVRQTNDKRLWTLPGGKVRRDESLSSALERELAEEIGQSVLSSQLVDLFDRPEKKALCVLFRTIIKGNKLRLGEGEIEASLFASKLPPNT
jgi:ADP-ribose pyrophosphatase YjhB (NUDIX family)